MAIKHVTIDATALAATAVIVYTVSENSVCKGVSISVFNGDASPRVFTTHKVPSGGSAGVTNIISTKTINNAQSSIISEVSVQNLEAGDFIAIAQDTGTTGIAAGGATEVDG